MFHRAPTPLLKSLTNSTRVLTLTLLCGGACADQAPEPAWSFDNNITTILASTQIVIAKLKIVSADSADSTTFKSLDRMVGYPVIGDAVIAGKPSARLINLLLDEDSYYDARIRCLNTQLYGMRFVADNKFIEVAIGLPCYQVIWAYQRESQVERWGAIFNKKNADEIISILNKSLEK